MKQVLSFFFTKTLFFLLFYIGISLFYFQPIYAADDQQAVATASSGWTKDSTVTFLGRGANRAESFMDWTFTNYKWNYSDGPLTNSWKAIRNIVYTMSILAVLVAGFLIIIKGSQNISVVVFIKEFIVALLLVTFSFALAHLFFQMADIFQLFFFQTAGTNGGIVTGKDIINTSFSQDFIGYRRTGVDYDESAFISLLLVQLSTITFYVIGSLLTVRKIILWFFLISSPLYPILLIYKPIKNTGKVWLQELLRWLLYGPLFALFLAAVIIIWKSNLLILPFNFNSSATTYPTAISILLGGPGQTLSFTNSINYNDTFMQYIVALLMLWVAILMPFILLQIILGFLVKHEFGTNPINGFINNIRNGVANNDFSFLKKSPPISPSPVGQHPGGLARGIPKYQTIREETNIKNQTFDTISQKTSNQSQIDHTSHYQTGQQTTQSDKNYRHTSQFSNQFTTKTQLKPEILSKPINRLINFSIPNMSDIVKFETARLNHNQTDTSELQKTEESLKKIANPKISSNPTEEEKFIILQEELNQETAKGNVLAESILSAAFVVRKPSNAKNEELETPIDLSVLPDINLPTVNQIQTVSFDDYEAVKALWLENYQESDIPDQNSSRKSWIEDDIQTVSQAITLLSSSDSIKVKEGLSSVSDILPFFLIGGFSQAEIIAYLKAKCTAAKLALVELVKKEENQETLIKKGVQKSSDKHLSQKVEISKKG